MLIKYIFLGIIQGLTEFLPVSSSAHLVIFQELFGLSQDKVVLSIALHLGSLAALIVFLFKDIKRFLKPRIVSSILLATFVTAVIVILGQDYFESMFSSGRLILPLIVSGIILLSTKKFGGGLRGADDLKLADGFWLGLVQGLSVIPGLSRSGVTISTLLFRGVERETAFKFSFLASILAILGALFFKVKDFASPACFDRYMLFGFLGAFLSGLLALKVLLAIIRRARFYLFGYYCLALALVLWRLL
ncbi:MAG: undecaprenyl-diphosphate phosphatase [Candidatus Omnitrophota bacterium]|nr:MAG: undecaprenyl-diphosphate phosphatase [Candidatus Omnitrophota bacterium]